MEIQRRSKSAAVFFSSICIFGFAACGGGGGGGDDTVVISGKAVFPDGIEGASGPAANLPVDVLDLERAPDDLVGATGMTDADGNYTVEIGSTKAIAVVVKGVVRVSGLVTAESDGSKDFNTVTDVACEAGVTAITEGAVDIAEFGDENIAILEEVAAQVIAEGGIDFGDPASVTAAAARVRELSDDGRSLPQ